MTILRTLSIKLRLDGPAFIAGSIVGVVAGIVMTGFLLGMASGF